MKLAGSFDFAVVVAQQNCNGLLFTVDGAVVHTGELYEIAKEFDAKTPLEEGEFLIVTEDGSIGLALPDVREPQWYFVSPEFAVANILKDDPQKYLVPVDSGVKTVGGAVAANQAKAFCKNCGAPLRPDSRFCENCGAKNAPEFCMNCGAKLKAGAAFCGECGSRV